VTIEEYRQAEAAVGSASARAKVVGDKTFVRRDDTWIDSRYQEGMDITKIGFASDNYYQLLGQRPDWGSYFALGEHVIFVVDGQAYEVTDGEHPPVEVSSNPDVPDTVGPNPDLVPLAAVQGNGGTNWALVAALSAVGAIVLAAAGGLLARSRVGHGKEGSQS